MSKTIAIIAPLIDNSQFNLDFTIRFKGSYKDLSLALIYRIASGLYDPSMEDNTSHEHDIPAAGYYLQGILHLHGYETVLTNQYDVETLRKLSGKDLLAICVSTTMILSSDSFIELNESINRELPGIPVIAGGMFLWKQFQQYSRHLHSPERYPLYREIYFHPSNARKSSNIIVIAEHGIKSLIEILSQLERGSNINLQDIPNLCLQERGEFTFTHAEPENIDYNNDFTRWDYIDELPVKIPVRTSIGCSYRCCFCDFCRVFPRVFLRSPNSLKSELLMIKNRLQGKATILHVTDDNVFINSKRLFEVCNIFSQSGLSNWIGFMRGGEYTNDELKAICDSGLRLGMIGVESGDQGQLDRMNKRQQVELVKKGIEQLDKAGVNTLLTFLVGYPGETRETINNTINFLNGLKLSNLLSGYQVYPLIIHNLSDLAEPDYREKWKITGFMNIWSHETMNSGEAYSACHKLFREVKNIPYHYPGESHFFNRAMFTREVLSELYQLRQQLTVGIMDNVTQGNLTGILTKIFKIMDVPAENIEKVSEGLICGVSELNNQALP